MPKAQIPRVKKRGTYSSNLECVFTRWLLSSKLIKQKKTQMCECFEDLVEKARKLGRNALLLFTDSLWMPAKALLPLVNMLLKPV